METLILTMQVMCVAGLAFGTTLSIFQLVKPARDMHGFDFAAANDFEPGFRRLVRNRR